MFSCVHEGTGKNDALSHTCHTDRANAPCVMSCAHTEGRLLSAVRPDMLTKGRLRSRGFPTQLAFWGSPQCASSHGCGGGRKAQVPPALCTCVWFRPTVHFQVRLEVGLAAEGFPTLLTQAGLQQALALECECVFKNAGYRKALPHSLHS